MAQRWNLFEIRGIAVRLSRTDRPISSAKARRVEGRGRVLASWSSSMSIQRTKRVGDIGHPWRTPDLRVIEGKSSDPSFNWRVLLG